MIETPYPLVSSEVQTGANAATEDCGVNRHGDLQKHYSNYFWFDPGLLFHLADNGIFICCACYEEQNVTSPIILFLFYIYLFYLCRCIDTQHSWGLE